MQKGFGAAAMEWLRTGKVKKEPQTTFHFAVIDYRNWLRRWGYAVGVDDAGNRDIQSLLVQLVSHCDHHGIKTVEQFATVNNLYTFAANKSWAIQERLLCFLAFCFERQLIQKETYVMLHTALPRRLWQQAESASTCRVGSISNGLRVKTTPQETTMNILTAKLKQLSDDTSGQDMVEYALLCGFMAAATAAIIVGIAPSLIALFQAFQAALDLAQQ